MSLKPSVQPLPVIKVLKSGKKKKIGRTERKEMI
jgi:hypothetical protein